MPLKKIFIWALRIVAAIIMLQTLYFKFTGQPESIALFTKLNMEPWGRYTTGIGELIASVLILLPHNILLGALLGMGLMSGALFFHFTILGVYWYGDATLFIYAAITFICCTILAFLYKSNFSNLIKLKF
jgi:uncharacterized membrane protein YphA (DoxX/SURF4 family)